MSWVRIPVGENFRLGKKSHSLVPLVDIGGTDLWWAGPRVRGLLCGLGLKARVKTPTIGGDIPMYEEGGGSFHDFSRPGSGLM
jgi:hypothetical protein